MPYGTAQNYIKKELMKVPGKFGFYQMVTSVSTNDNSNENHDPLLPERDQDAPDAELLV